MCTISSLHILIFQDPPLEIGEESGVLWAKIPMIMIMVHLAETQGSASCFCTATKVGGQGIDSFKVNCVE
jgi:hypothetical protein